DLAGEALIDDLDEARLVDPTDPRQESGRERAADGVLRMAGVADRVEGPPADVGVTIDGARGDALLRVRAAFDGVRDVLLAGRRRGLGRRFLLQRLRPFLRRLLLFLLCRFLRRRRRLLRG